MSWWAGKVDDEQAGAWLALRLGFWIAAFAVLAFLPAIGCDFVNMDDTRNFLYNKALNYPLEQKLAWAWTTRWLGVYQPLSWMLIFCEHAFWTVRPFGYHLVSLVLHALVGIALFVVTRMLLVRTQPAAAEKQGLELTAAAGMAVLLFCVHPLRTEVVVWASAQPYLPSVLFMLLGVAAYLKAHESDPTGKVRKKWLAASFGLGAGAMLFKAVAVTYPLVLLVLDAYPLRRLNLSAGDRNARRKSFLAVLEKLPLLALSLILMIVARGAKNHPHFESGEPLAVPLSVRLADAAYGVWFYPCKTLVPIGLTIVYPREDASAVHLGKPGFAVCAAGVVAVSILAWLLRRRWPGFGATWVAYLIILAPNSGLVRFSPQLGADRYSYAASLPWVLIVASGLFHVMKDRASVRYASVAFSAVVVLGLSVMSWYQCATWKHSVSLWTHALEAGAGRSLEAHGNLALALSMVGFEDDALVQYEAAVRVAPRSAKACMYLAESLARHGRKEEAITRMRQAVQAAPDIGLMHYYLGSFLMRYNQNDEAETALREALRLDPGIAEAHRDLGVLLALCGLDQEARRHLEKALEIQPDDPVAKSNLEQFLGDQKARQPARKPPRPMPALPVPRVA